MHLNVTDVQQWYADRYPGAPVGSLVPGRCYFCWHELATGSPVVIRHSLEGVNQVTPGTKGVVEQVISAADGSIYLVRLESGEDRYFIRAELRKVDAGDAAPSVAPGRGGIT